MTQEEKDLVLIDLSGRWRYGVKVKINSKPRKLMGVYDEYVVVKGKTDGKISWDNYGIEEYNIKPYLRPMSSMTEEERKYANEHFFSKSDNFEIDDVGEMYVCPQPYETVYTLSLAYQSEYFDWLNANHFDYRYLIPKGLALPASEGMYDAKNE